MAETATWKVHKPDEPRRVMFEGPESAARQYVVNNFPRPHVNPGTLYDDGIPPYDVHLSGPAGELEAYVADESGWRSLKDSAPVEDSLATTYVPPAEDEVV